VDGFGFPKEERAALVAADAEKFFLPIPSDLRYNWVRVWLQAIDQTEMRELVVGLAHGRAEASCRRLSR
jgi:hypothetical protein